MSWRDAHQRREEVKAAFAEGFRRGTSMVWDMTPAGELEAWESSQARAGLHIPIPPDRCKCGSRRFRMAAGREELICAECHRPAFPATPPIGRAEPKLERGQIQVGEAAERAIAPKE